MHDLTRIFYYVFGAFSMIGGIIGFLKARSIASLIAGDVSGMILILCGLFLPKNPTVCLIVAGAVSVALAGRFVPAALKTGKMMPAGLMALFSVVAIVLTVMAFLKK